MGRTLSPQELRATLVNRKDVMLLDVRRKSDYDADSLKIPDAVWRNPDEIDQWSAQLPKGKEFVVYCVRGGSVSNAVIDHLNGKQLKASYIEGGIEAWKASGGLTVDKDTQT